MAPIYANARRFLGPDKIARLACFDFARLKFDSDMCITCIGMLPNFGQWDGTRNCVYVLENCESFFKPIERECQSNISNEIECMRERDRHSREYYRPRRSRAVAVQDRESLLRTSRSPRRLRSVPVGSRQQNDGSAAVPRRGRRRLPRRTASLRCLW